MLAIRFIQEYRGEIQLTAFVWSPIAVFRPSAQALQLYENHTAQSTPEHPTDSENDWIYGKELHTPLNLQRANELWRFARRRMAFHPNVDSRYTFTNADIVQNVGNQEEKEAMLGKQHGDLTVMICSIIPYPEEAQTLTTCKGLLRCWDGTGAPRSDP